MFKLEKKEKQKRVTFDLKESIKNKLDEIAKSHNQTRRAVVELAILNLEKELKK